MGVQIALPLALGALAATSGTAHVTFEVIFAVTLSSAKSPTDTRITSIVAAGLGTLDVALLGLLLARQARCRNTAPTKVVSLRRQHVYVLAGFAGVFGLLSAVESAVVLGMMRSRESELPTELVGSKTSDLIVGGFVVWAVTLLSQAAFIICMIIMQRKEFQSNFQHYEPDSTPEVAQSEIERSRPRALSLQSSEHKGKVELDSPPSSSGRSRAGSDTRGSIRSSFSQVVRPITSKSKLISSQSSPSYRPTSHELSPCDTVRDTVISIDADFDSWDTSTVDADSRHALQSASPTLPRFLETIPASPTVSRSPSPGFPLDLEPPKQSKRSRSYSPVNSLRDRPRSRTVSPTNSMKEAHIHPLFRSDSPTPPPAATPGTMVTAAPGAGQLISSSASIRSRKSNRRLRSGSLGTSPLMHQDSLDSIRRTIEREELEIPEEDVVERSLTPPIPDWILNGAAPRTSMSLSRKSRKSAKGLGKVYES